MLTTISNVKARLKLPAADVADDALLSQFIANVSGRFENDCNRSFGYILNQVDEFQADETELRVSHYPIDEAQPITFSLLEKASLGWQPVPMGTGGADFVLRAGCIISLIAMIAQWKSQIRVTYSGGYLLPDADPGQYPSAPALPADLVGAATEQVVFFYQNKDRLGITTQSGQGGSFHLQSADLLPTVAAVLKRYERWMP